MTELRQLYHSGDSVVVAIPRKWLRTLAWGKGMTIRLELVDRKITLEKAVVVGEEAFLARRP